MSKLQRRNQAKQLRIHHKEKQDHESTIFQGADGAAKQVAVVSLSDGIDLQVAVSRLSESVEATISQSQPSQIQVRVERFKRNLRYLPTTENLLEVLDVCKVADWVLFLVSAEQILGPDEDMLLRAIEGQGITSTAVIVTDIESKIPAARRSKCWADVKNQFSVYFAGLDKYTALENKSDCANLVRSLCMANTRGIRWRDNRSWMLIESVEWRQGESLATPLLRGTVRGKGLNPDRLVHVPGWGEYKVKMIREVPPQAHKRKADEMAVEPPLKEWQPTMEQDNLDDLAPETAEMMDVASTTANTEHKGVLLDDHHYFSDDNSHIPSTPKKLPQGTSNYQAAWYLDDVSDSDSDIMDDEDGIGGEEVIDDTDISPEDGIMLKGDDVMTDVAGTEYPESEMLIDVNAEEEARQLQEFRASRKQEAEDDLEFPDEIELHPEVLARERLVKYRGLKSLRTSEWNTEGDKPYQPMEYDRLLQVPDYKKSYNSAVKEVLAGGVPLGTKVEIELEGVPPEKALQSSPISLFSLLRHEHKQAVVNLNMSLSSEIDDPVKSKEELIVQIGHRRFAINPVFSAAGQTPNDVHKFDRFLHPGRSAVATFTGPLTWGSIPVLVFRHHKPDSIEEPAEAPSLVSKDVEVCATPPSSQLSLVGTATTMPPSSSRVIAKRAVLTGHPFKIHKKLVTVRYMFFNREDVLWFSALPLFTKRGRQGWIKEPLGTHGYFKAIFDGNGKVNTMDAIGVSLYKRVWPRPSRRLE